MDARGNIRKAKSMNQCFYNMAKTYWALKHVLFVYIYEVFTIYCEGEQSILKRHDSYTPQSVQQRLTWFLKLLTENSLLRFKYSQNVGKQSQKYSRKM